MLQVIEKVTAFITRPSPHGSELLLFQHPNAGIQIPAGTVEANETPVDAASREAAEETGLTDLPPGCLLGSTTEMLPDDQRVICETTRVYARPDTSSFDWASLRRGVQVASTRQEAGFSQINYIEWDDLANPSYVSYQITGWVPNSALASRRTRYFFHFVYHNPTANQWWTETDNHRFRLFWAPLTALPTIVYPQNRWLEVLVQNRIG